MTPYRCGCCIVPSSVLDRLAGDRKLSAELRRASAQTAQLSDALRRLRGEAAALTGLTLAGAAKRARLAAAPKVTVYDCKHTQTLPGSPVTTPARSRDATVRRTFTQTTAVAEFYRSAFKRNSIDNAGMTMMSSVHYGSSFNNAMWNGSQMIYGDGDGKLFVDFTKGNDVIAHELTHGVTQHTLQLGYTDDAGGLNESLSDCFGSMFRQWQADHDSAKADWLIGKDIVGPTAKARGYTCLRNMADPAAASCLAPQPTHYSQVTPGMDPHESSGPPNLAFCLACKAAGGRSWQTVGPVWYAAMTAAKPNPKLTMKAFAKLTRQLARQRANAKVASAVDAGWKQVGL
ncbi:MAG: M4 family metallopeptidase [Burkholderiaceae bacterium]